MNVWVLTDHHDEVSIYSEDTNVLDIPYVSIELSYLTSSSAYEAERDEFIADIARARKCGRGYATIEERFSIELKPLG